MDARLRYLIVATFIALFLMFALSAYGQEIFSPGPIDKVHSGSAPKCDACHVPLMGEPDYKCLGCHQKEAKEKQDHRGLHAGALGTCNGCHQLHDNNGAKVGEEVLKDPSKFNHNLLSFGLNGHYNESCNGCHPQGFGSIQASACVDCHKRRPDAAKFNNHVAALGTNCLSCHNGRQQAKFKHTANPQFFINKHLSVKCGQCHKKGTYSAVSTTCNECHKKKHKAFYGTDCQNCHQISAWKTISFNHTAAAFGLNDHKNQACFECHQSQFGAVEASICLKCHHRIAKNDRFDNHVAALGDKCYSCHDGFSRPKFSHSGDAAFFTGKHLSTACDKCHKNSTYAAVSLTCKECHEKKHPALYGTDCQKCHQPTGWKSSTFNHQPPLTGRHQDISCIKCHSGSTFALPGNTCDLCHKKNHDAASSACQSCHNTGGWQQLTFDHGGGDCAACHRSPANHHGNACANCHSIGDWKKVHNHSPGAVCNQCHSAKHAGATDCRRCHTFSGWAQLTFNHGAGNCAGCHGAPSSHYGGSCASCHSTGSWKDPRYHSSGIACGTCHAGPHTSPNVTDCRRCHNTSVWAQLTFNHAGSNCAGCHSTPANHYGTTCSSCHTINNWNATFNHPYINDKHTYKSFPCAYCHPSGYSSYSCLKCHSSNNPGDD